MGKTVPPGFTRRRAVLLAALLYLAYAIFLTWPLATDLGGRISAPAIGGDLSGAIGHTSQVVDQNVFPLLPARLPGLDAPTGLQENWVLNWATLPGTAILYGLSFLFGAIAGHGLFLLLGFVLSGSAMFLLCRRLFGSTEAALLAGFAFAFYPFAVGKTEAHLHFVHGWVLVLLVWRMLELAREPSRRNALLGGLAAAFAMWFTPYFVLIGGVGFAVLVAVAITAGALRGEARRAVGAVTVACVPIAALFGALGALTVLSSGSGTSGVRSQPLEQLYIYAARLHEFLVPDRRNLVFGDSTESYLTARLHGSNFSESSLYLGISVIALALVGAWLGAALARRSPREAAHDIRLLAVGGGGALAITALAFSAPPKLNVLGHLIPTPSFAVFQITSTWRVYSRFVVLIELGLCLLAAFALARMLAGRGRSVRGVLTVLVGLVLMLDLWARPDIRTTEVRAIDAYVWLRAHPGGIVADYPLTAASFPSYGSVFWQSFHRHRLLNGYSADTETESAKLELADLADAETPGNLAAFGVRYVVTRPDVPGSSPGQMRANGYALRLARPDASVWEVRARPSKQRVDALSGFAPPEGGPNQEFRWMAGPGVLSVVADCGSCSGQVVFTSSSSDVPRRLTVRDETNGRVITTLAIPVSPQTTVRVPVTLKDGRARLLLETDLPAAPPLSGGDPRALSLTVLEPRFERDR